MPFTAGVFAASRVVVVEFVSPLFPVPLIKTQYVDSESNFGGAGCSSAGRCGAEQKGGALQVAHHAADRAGQVGARARLTAQRALGARLARAKRLRAGLSSATADISDPNRSRYLSVFIRCECCGFSLFLPDCYHQQAVAVDLNRARAGL